MEEEKSGLFGEPSATLKTVAYITVILGWIGSIVLALTFGKDRFGDLEWGTFLGILIGGMFSCYLSGLLLYGFGTLLLRSTAATTALRELPRHLETKPLEDNTSGATWTLPVVSEIKEGLLQPFTAVLQKFKGKTTIRLQMQAYQNVVPQSVFAVIQVKTRLGNSYPIGGIEFLEGSFSSKGSVWETKTERCEVPEHILNGADILEVVEIRYLENGVLHVFSASADAAVPSQSELNSIRRKYGNDAVRCSAETSERWFCACGAENPLTESACHRCGRIVDRQKPDNGNDAPGPVLDAVSRLKSAAEILQYIKENVPLQPSDARDQLMSALEAAVKYERFYGAGEAQRNACIKALETYFA